MAETSGLLNRRTGNSRTEGSNPSVSATFEVSGRPTKSGEIGVILLFSNVDCPNTSAYIRVQPNLGVGSVKKVLLLIRISVVIFFIILYLIIMIYTIITLNSHISLLMI